MKTFLKIVRGIIAGIFSIAYIAALPVILLAYPISSFITDSDNVNSVIDELNLEEQILTEVAPNLIQTRLEEEENTEVDPIMLDEAISHMATEENLTTITSERRRIVESLYGTIDQQTEFNYQIPQETASDLYDNMMESYISQIFDELDMCTDEQMAAMEGTDLSEAQLDEIECIPQGYNEETLLLEITPDEDQKEMELPEIKINENVTQKIHVLFEIGRYMVVVPIILMIFILIFAPSKKAALLFLGIYNLLGAIASGIIWFMSDQIVTSRINDLPLDIDGLENQNIQETITALLQDVAMTILDKMTTIGLLISVLTGIIGLIFIVLKLFIASPDGGKKDKSPKRENTSEQSDISSKT